METEMQRLPLTFTKNGFTYKQVCRTARAVIYSQKLYDQDKVVYYEVWKIYTRRARLVFGKPVPAMEYGPGGEDWGNSGWTVYTLEEALKRYDWINANDNVPEKVGAGKNR